MNRKLALYLSSSLFFITLNSCHNSTTWEGVDFIRLQDSIKSPYDISIDMEFANGKNEDYKLVANTINATLQDAFLEKVDTNNISTSIKEYIDNLCNTYKQEDSEFHLERYNHLKGRFEFGISGIVNYVLTEDYYGGGAHPTNTTTILCFNTETGDQITTDELIVDSCRQKMKDLLTSRLMQYHGVSTLDSLQAMGYLDMSDMFISENFMLGEDSVSFLYNPYDIAPYALGNSTISFSYDELKDIITFGNNNK
ncbi:MAG: RsiV family protein [Bacteroidaceae bacterium]|nr:RsiV family protein [Bacteroidaceae bacterium]